MSDEKSSGQKRKRGYYQWKDNKKGRQGGAGGKHKKKYELQVGMVGFLATLNDKQQKQATSELLNILPDFLPSGLADEEAAASSAPSDGLAKGGDDIAAMLAAENATASLLQFCDTRVPNIVFIRLPSEQADKVNINNVVYKIFESVEGSTTSAPRHISRYVLRLVPVIATCPAYLDRINKGLKEALASFIASLQPSELESYAHFNLCFKSTYNQSIKSQEVEDILICHMASLAPSIRHNRSAREHVLIVGVHILKTVCCISFLRDYYRFAKYNLAEFQAKQLSSDADTSTKDELKS